MGSRLDDRSRLILFYAAIFSFIGVHLPFWPVWLKAQGLSAEELGLVIAAGTWVRIAANPLVGHFADARAERRMPILVLSVASALVFLAFAVVQGFWPLLLVAALFGLVWTPVMSLQESLTLLTAHEKKFDYGRIRLWGSLAFMVVSIGAGWALQDRPATVIFVMLAVALCLQCAAAYLLPDARPQRLAALERWPIGRLVRNKLFLLFLLSVGLIQASHGMVYAFGTLHWRAVGLGDNLIGLLWAQGVVAEIILFTFGQALFRRVGAANLMILGAAAGALRWLLTAFVEDFWWLLMVQLLHAFTFGASHLGAVHFLLRAIRPQDSASAQSLLAASTGGIGLGFGIALSGVLYASLQGQAFLVMAALSFAGVACAIRLAKRWTGEPLL